MIINRLRETTIVTASLLFGVLNSIHVVRDGAEALDYLFRAGQYAGLREQRLPPVILLDLKLPKLSGMEVLARVKSDVRTEKTPVIVLTACSSSPDIQQSRQLGADAYRQAS